jgi:hypothetical protein
MAEISARHVALAQSLRMSNAQNIERVGKEMKAIDEIRRKRLAAKANRFRRNSISAAVCFAFCATGFLIALSLTHESSPKPLNLKAQPKNEQQMGKADSSLAPILAPSVSANAKFLGPTLIEVANSAQAPQPTTAPTKAPTLPAPQTLDAAAETYQSQTVARTSQPSVNRFAIQPKSIAPTHKTKTPVVPAMAISPTVAIKPAGKSETDAEVVLPARLSKQEPSESRFQEKSASGSGNDFKVVNVIDGALIVRQGQTVRQFKIGDQLPSGKILKSVDTESLKFEVSP